MRIRHLWTALLIPAALLAQPQIGGGTCSSAALNGNYSLTLSGRTSNAATGPSGVAFTGVLQGIGIANFDGLSKVTFTLMNNMNSAAGLAQTWSGTYSLQANCIGVVNITSGDAATLTLTSYNRGAGFSIDGSDETYSLTGGGSAEPTAACSAGLLSGTYSFNGNGVNLSSGAIGGLNDISGLITFDGVGTVTTNWYLALSGSNQNLTTSGTYTVNANCTASATLSDSSGNKYALELVITSAKGANFLIDESSAGLLFIGGGRTL